MSLHATPPLDNAMLAKLWPDCYRRGLLKIIGRPATSEDLRDICMERRREDLKRRARIYAQKKEAARAK